ncbi:MAG: nicotinate (nicotinamide) nucleotide adenylyltransferase [Deltaproteobacteria bacterium]|jgi:nicotinate-nucleotide adenylyltransferase|nr:nicotinate (nicotinamide) nucleotide adenylyltransferase [Deltaproteobacteria bacterium]
MISRPLLALLGGSFNPPHIGHFRIALEVLERLAPSGVLLIPCANPPHKTRDNLLPFSLRLAMLEAVTSALPGLGVSSVEAERPGPSYTVDTLAALAAEHPEERLAFILGGDDFSLLPAWRRWRSIPELADLVVLPRQAEGEKFFLRTIDACWPEAVPLPAPEGIRTFGLPHGGRLVHLPQPRLEISSSLVRSRWLAGRRLKFLIPGEVEEMLDAHAPMVRSLWQS